MHGPTCIFWANRTSFLLQIIDGIKAVKFFAWEEDFFAQVICL